MEDMLKANPRLSSWDGYSARIIQLNYVYWESHIKWVDILPEIDANQAKA